MLLPCKKTRSQDRLRHCGDTSKGPETRVNAEEMRVQCGTAYGVQHDCFRDGTVRAELLRSAERCSTKGKWRDDERSVGDGAET